MNRKSLPSWLVERPFAHRGLHKLSAGRPENTLPAFEAAVSFGYGIELDVHRLRDGSLVVFHDDDLKRAAGSAQKLADLSYAELAALGLFGTEHRAPRLEEVLRLVSGRVPLLLEIKHKGQNTQVAKAVSEAIAGYRGPIAVQSFNPYVVRWFSRHAPHHALGQLGGPLRGDPLRHYEKVASRRLLTLLVSRADFINFDLRGLPDPWVSLVGKLAQLPVLCWTVRSELDRTKATALGLNYVFENILP